MTAEPVAPPTDAPESLRRTLARGAVLRKSSDVRFVVDACFDVGRGETPPWLQSAVALCDLDVVGVALLRKTKVAWGRTAREVASAVAAQPELPKTAAAAEKYWARRSLKRLGYLDFVQGLPDDLLGAVSRQPTTAAALEQALGEAWSALAHADPWGEGRRLGAKVEMTARWLGLGGTDRAVACLASLLRDSRAAGIEPAEITVKAARDGILHGLALTRREEAVPTLVTELLSRRTDSAFEGTGPRQAVLALAVCEETAPVFTWLAHSGWLVTDVARMLADSRLPWALDLLDDLARRTRRASAVEALTAAGREASLTPHPSYDLLFDPSMDVRHETLRSLGSREPVRRGRRVSAPDHDTHRLALACAELLDIELQRQRRSPDHPERVIAMSEFWNSFPVPEGLGLSVRIADSGSYGPHSDWQVLLRHLVQAGTAAELAGLPEDLRRVRDDGAEAVAARRLAALPAPPPIFPFVTRESELIDTLRRTN